MTTIVRSNVHTSARHITVGAYTFPSSFLNFTDYFTIMLKYTSQMRNLHSEKKQLNLKIIDYI